MALIALDTRHFWLPDALTLPLLGLGLALGPGAFTTRLLSAAIGGGTFFLIALLFRWLRKKEGMGMGDVKLMAALGAWINPQFLPPLLLVAALIGLISAGFSALRGRKSGAKSQPEMRVAFGACLAVAAFPIWLLAAATDNMEHRRQALETNHLAPYRLTIIDEPGHAKAPPKSPTMRGRIIVKTAATAGPHPTAGRIPPCR